MNQFVYKSALFLFAGASVFASNVYAHHGVNGQFDESVTIKVEGVVTKSRLVNPHAYIYFNVLDAQGESNEWRCELGTGSTLKRAGWTSGTFAKGTHIKVVGSPARSEDNACYVHTITFDDGVTIKRNSIFDKAGQLVKQPRQTALADGTPNIDGTWVAERPKRARCRLVLQRVIQKVSVQCRQKAHQNWRMANNVHRVAIVLQWVKVVCSLT
ncbi:DUF6152 family protein [Marinomonas sp. GJ51-6]|uniref:DUF6152 family protein n=1 Tax=Marinomonas sp. GJ51-6 TaxID=2992802 RepID=UPI002934EE24|nr:DUF6152 family protein [Marinomonas sp. GJ51-6]WOD06684.1 DUF6152 family protein [Marinomonas sp. GJ51-6]